MVRALHDGLFWPNVVDPRRGHPGQGANPARQVYTGQADRMDPQRVEQDAGVDPVRTHHPEATNVAVQGGQPSAGEGSPEAVQNGARDHTVD